MKLSFRTFGLAAKHPSTRLLACGLVLVGAGLSALPAQAENNSWMGGGGLKIPAQQSGARREQTREPTRMAYAAPAPQPSRGLFDFMFGNTQPNQPAAAAPRTKTRVRAAKPVPTATKQGLTSATPAAVAPAAVAPTNPNAPLVVTIAATPPGSTPVSAVASIPAAATPQARAALAPVSAPVPLPTAAEEVRPGYAKGVPINPLD